MNLKAHKSGVAGLLLLHQLILGMRGKSGVIDPAHLGMGLQEFCHLHGRGLVRRQPDLHGPQSPYHKPCLHRAHDSAQKLPVGSQLFHEFLVLYRQHTSDNIAVSSNVLGCGVHHDIRPQIQGLLINRGTERIIYVDQRLVFPGNPGHGPYILKGKHH